MIDLREIEDTIRVIRRDGTTIGDAQKLALLFIVRDAMAKEDDAEKTKQDRASSPPIVPRHRENASDFIQACEGVPIERVLDVLDEHMEAIAMLYPKEYDKVIRQIMA